MYHNAENTHRLAYDKAYLPPDSFFYINITAEGCFVLFFILKLVHYVVLRSIYI